MCDPVGEVKNAVGTVMDLAQNPFLNPIGAIVDKTSGLANKILTGNPSGLSADQQIKYGALIASGVAAADAFDQVGGGGMIDPVTGQSEAGMGVPYGEAAGGVAGGVAGGAATTPWYANPYVIGGGLNLAGGILGYKGSKDAQDQQSELAGQYMAMGEPYRGKLAELYNNPNAYLDSQRADVANNVQQGTDIMARSLSTTGNPTGSANALQQLQNYSSKQMNDQLYQRLNAERQNMANFGGLSAFNSAAPTMSNEAIKSGANAYNAIGYGMGSLGDIFNNQNYGRPRYDQNTGQRIS